jgi:hypothetical protein
VDEVEFKGCIRRLTLAGLPQDGLTGKNYQLDSEIP